MPRSGTATGRDGQNPRASARGACQFKVGVAEQLVLPCAALLVIACTFLGDWAVLAAGLVSALAVAAGVTLTARTAAGEHRAKDAETAETGETAEEA